MFWKLLLEVNLVAERQIIVNRKLPKTTSVQNGIIWDENISTMARFALIAMLSMREGWDYSVRGMAAMLHISKDTMSKYIRELEDAGYLKREQRHSQKGKFEKAVYILTDTPGDFGEEEPCPKNYDTEEPCHKMSAPVTSAPTKSPQQIRNTKQQKRQERTTTPTPPQEGPGRVKRSKYDLAEEAKPILRTYVGEDRELAQAMGALIEVRVAKKAINSARAVKMLLGDLDRLAQGSREDKLKIIRQSVTNSWKGVFPLKNGDRPRGSGGHGDMPPAPERVVEEEGTYLL